jgi:hypothetical protein
MTFARRLSAVTMALVLALVPLAMERCRTACVTGAAVPTPSADACHEASADDSGVRMDPMARACGHSDEARTYESAGLAAAKTRTVLLLLPLAAALPRHVDVASAWVSTDWSPDRARLRRPLVPLNSPLRL